MSDVPRLTAISPVLAALAASALFLAGCDATERASAPGAEAPAAIGTGPATEDWTDKEARFKAAIEGLRFGTGVVTVADAANNPRLSARLTENAADSLQTNRLFDAIATYRRALHADPTNARAYFGLGESLLGRGKNDLAIAAYRTAVVFDPNFSEARYKLANVLQMDGDLEGAIAAMEELVALRPNHAEAHERLAIWNRFAGRYDAAWTHVFAAEDLGHAVPPHFVALLEKDRPKPARNR